MVSKEYQEQPIVNWGTAVTAGKGSWGEETSPPCEPRTAVKHRCNGNLSKKDQNKNLLSLILKEIRSFMAKYLHNCSHNRNITRLIYSLLIIILFISVNILPARASIDVPLESTETVSISTEEDTMTGDSTPEEVIEETKTSSNETVSIPAEIETADAPVETQQTESLKIEKTPPPQPVITPEQILFSAVQKKISEIASQDYEELIVSGKADLLAGRLLIKVSDDWYQMDRSSQDKFVNETLQRSQQFKIKKLEIQDLQDNLIARSPVVGNKMIILQRAN